MNEIVKSGVCSKVCVMYYGSIKASILLITLLSIYSSVVRFITEYLTKYFSIECQIYFDKVSTTAKLYKEFKYILGIDLDKGINGA